MSKYELRKKLRYVYVSLFTAPIGQVLLFLFYEVGKLNPLLSNVLAVTISTTPNYLLNRFWVWRKSRSQIFAMKLCLIGCLLF